MKIASNKIADIVRFFREELKGLYENGEIETFISYCFEAFIGMKRAAISINANTTVSESELLKFNFAVKDLKRHKPIQYILGEADFYGMKFYVNEHVLIPRPETEELVQLISSEFGVRSSEFGAGRLSILDIGTGTGCIAIALKKQIEDVDVYAIDVSQDALEVAMKNAQKNTAGVKFYKHDILDDIASFPVSDVQFDIIVSNPPYIALSEKEQMDKNVTAYEPHIALFVDDNDPLLFYRAIADFALRHLKKSGKIYFEINQKLGSETRKLLEDKGYSNVQVLSDLNTNHRIVTATFK
ncbi:MAG: peptide chain release factor N(5)-glutamine methyltransferase [Bacteroidia bacterium]